MTHLRQTLWFVAAWVLAGAGAYAIAQHASAWVWGLALGLSCLAAVAFAVER